MSMVEFLPRSPFLDGEPKLNDALRIAVLRGILGYTNANRLLANTNVADVVSDSTFEQIVAIAEDDPSIVQVRDDINPVLRCASDFEPGEEIVFQVPRVGSHWVREKVWAVREPHISEDDGLDGKDVINGGIVVKHNPDFAHIIGAQWPALMPADLYDSIANRHRTNNGEKLVLSGVGGLFFRLPLYAVLPMEHYSAARNALRHFRMQTPHKRT